MLIPVPSTLPEIYALLAKAHAKADAGDWALLLGLTRFLGHIEHPVWSMRARGELRRTLVRGGVRVIQPIIAEMERSPTGTVVDAGEAILSDLPSCCAVALRDAYQDETKVRIRYSLLTALCAVARTEYHVFMVEDILREALSDPDPDTRESAACIAGQTLNFWRPVLEERLEWETVPWVRDTIREVLDRAG